MFYIKGNFDQNYLLHPDPDEKAQDKNQYLKLGQDFIPQSSFQKVQCVLINKINTFQKLRNNIILIILFISLLHSFLLTRSFVR